jgi:hypothetical protein
MEVSVETVKVALTVLLVTQGIKKLPWLSVILDKYTGGWFAMILALVVGIAEKYTEIAADGKLEAGEAMQLVAVVAAAMGAHFGLKTIERKTA